MIGARRRGRLVEALGDLDLHLDAADMARIETAVPGGAVAGNRYGEAQMAHLASERSARG